ncbi:DUF116 domain-containing protein [bacterium]|nr:DUF116 domain-containing protein [candidate division CSSED10-310 bacterium]
MNKWRLLDTKHKTAAENMALDEILLESVSKGQSPNTFRFLQFKPHAVLVGFHQSIDLEIRKEYCINNGININRRITGGGAILFEENHIGWEIICRKRVFPAYTNLNQLFELFCTPLVCSLRRMGIQAAFRARNDIEVNGRKISGTGGTDDANGFLFQGTLLMDLDIEKLLKSLRIPVEKLQNKEFDAIKDRITTVRRELGYLPDIQGVKELIASSFSEAFHTKLCESDLTTYEKQRITQRLPYYQSADWIESVTIPNNKVYTIHASRKSKGGLIRFSGVIDTRNSRFQSVMISGDFFSYPQRVIRDLECVLKDCRTRQKDVLEKISDFFNNRRIIIPDIKPVDFVAVIDEAISKTHLVKYGFSIEECNRIFTVNGNFSEIIHENISVLLLPYCAKKTDCSLRYETGCRQCGKCSVSEGFHEGFQHGLEVISIQSFEDLMSTIEKLKTQGVRAYIGCCCEPFYVKHRADFEKSHLPAILIDVENTSCYELDEMKSAYKGEFRGQTLLDIPLLKKVLNVAC